MIKLLPLIVFLFFASGFLYAQDKPDSVIIIKGSRTVPVMQHDNPNNIIIIDGVVPDSNSNPQYGDPIIGHPNLTLKDSLRNEKDTVKSDTTDEKRGNINIRGNRSNENIIIIDGVITTNPITGDSNAIVPDSLLQKIEVYKGEFTAEYGFNIHEYRAIKYKWNISHSIGFAPEESKPTFFVSITTLISKNLSLGLRGGIYTYQSPLDSAVNDTIRSRGPYNAGFYILTTDFITQGPSYIGALYGAYHVGKNILINGSAGIKMYSEDTWGGNISFSVSNNNSYPPTGSVSPRANLNIKSSENIIKPYFSLGAVYKVGRFLIGVFGDNIFSFGATIGIGFN